MQGKICLITGATSGIGEAVAHALYDQGAHLVLVGRNLEKLNSLAQALSAKQSVGRVDILVADLSSQAEIRKLAAEFLEKYNRLDVLINNAGGVFASRKVSVDGYEQTFALNHLNYFLLTNLLLDVLKATPGARVISTASHAHKMVDDMYWDDLQLEKKYGRRGWDAYAQSKLANVLFTYELARRLEGSGVKVNCVHPGFVRTALGTNNGPIVKLIVKLVMLRARPVEKGAETIIWAASSDEAGELHGQYLYDLETRRSSAASLNQESWTKLWQLSEEMTGLA